MVADDHVPPIARFGFTARQARFLVTVMRHAGVCLPRQYARFAGIVQGQKTRAFFAKLVDRGYAAAYPCRHNRGRVYHVHQYALYAAIGEPNSRYRRPVTASAVIERLIVLDTVIAGHDHRWLESRAEKLAHVTADVRSARAAGAASAWTAAARSSADAFADGGCCTECIGGRVTRVDVETHGGYPADVFVGVVMTPLRLSTQADSGPIAAPPRDTALTKNNVTLIVGVHGTP